MINDVRESMKIILISSLCLLNLCLSSYAQEHAPDAKADYWNELYKSVVNEYGFDQVLVNGIFYEDDLLGKIGHPFLFENRFYQGTLIFRGNEYKGIEMKYDIYDQQLLIYVTQNYSNAWIIPPNAFISAFSFDGKAFVKYTLKGEPKFYQVVFDSEKLKCLYYWLKSRYDSDHERKFYSYGFTESARKSYLLLNDILLEYKNNSSFVRLFPQEIKYQIERYIKSNRIKVNKCDDSVVQKLIIYCNSLL
jgi:hypothetical protein